MGQAVVPSYTQRALKPVSTAFYRPELDSLRFLAFLFVFLHHNMSKQAEFYVARGLPGDLSYLAKAGAFGVDLFFCLSAYLITELLVREKEKYGHLDVSAFYLRRILRIWPLYFLMIAISAALPLLVAGEHFAGRYVLAFLLLAGNWSFVFFGVPASIAVPLWSISVEEQFYLLWPLAVRKASRAIIATFAVTMVMVAIVARYLVVHHAAQADRFLWNSTLTRLDPIAYGILLAVVLHGRMPKLAAALRAVMFVLGFLLWTEAAKLFDSSPQLSYPLIALGSLLLLVAVLGAESRLLRNQALVKLGTVSYGLYVYHYFVMAIVGRAFVRVHGEHFGGLFPVLLLFVFDLLGTIGLALLSYRFFETPFLRLKQRFAHIESRPVAPVRDNETA